jgi:hypothetical protein
MYGYCLVTPARVLQPFKTRRISSIARIIDPHLHFLDPVVAQPFLKSLGAPRYTPEQYAADAGQLPIKALVHVEALSTGVEEVLWVDSLAAAGRCNVKAIVASCNLADDDAEAQLLLLKAASSKVRGIRWILDFDGAFFRAGATKESATHVACSRPGARLPSRERGKRGALEREKQASKPPLETVAHVCC